MRRSLRALVPERDRGTEGGSFNEPPDPADFEEGKISDLSWKFTSGLIFESLKGGGARPFKYTKSLKFKGRLGARRRVAN